ncbi:MAG: hypothetical protein QME27_08635, partial [Syntrophaceae bacterium]|nr:hypothetical protein [Syntrophaceae bacterium]
MGLVKINQISPGMELAEDLRDSRGRFLLPSGVGLTARDIRVLKMWGVVEADIQGIGTDGVEDAAAREIDPSLMEMAEKVVTRQFRYADAARSDRRGHEDARQGENSPESPQPGDA